MSWDPTRSKERIRQFLKTVPEFEGKLTLREHTRLRVQAKKGGLVSGASARSAFLVSGAHLYGQLLDFDGLVAENDQETERSHKLLLGTLHEHYRLWDSIVDDEDADRIDYHGGRMHAVVTEPAGAAREQMLNAIALAHRLADASKSLTPQRPIRLRFGIDQGPCLAMTTGRAFEKDVLFLGRPANHAAKLAAAANTEGVFLSRRAQEVVGVQHTHVAPSGLIHPSQQLLEEALRKYPFERIVKAAEEIRANRGTLPAFTFFRPTPPLAGHYFKDFSPSRTARMGMAVVFGDVHGFTNYVDMAISRGEASVRDAAVRMHVIREELNAVLKDDFGGKRVRFIGDCIHGALAAGEIDDEPEIALVDAFLCATGMRDSFQLIKSELGEMDSLNLAVGVEYGPTPMTRLGLRGEDSVRCSTSRAVVRAEAVQQSLPAGGIKFGDVAVALAPPRLRSQLLSSQAIPTYANASKSFGTGSARPLLRPAAAAAVPAGFPNRPTGPTKTDGFS